MTFGLVKNYKAQFDINYMVERREEQVVIKLWYCTSAYSRLRH